MPSSTIMQTFGYIVDMAREILNDKQSDAYRWTEAQLLRFAHEGIQTLIKLRPAAGYYGLKRVKRDLVLIADDAASYEADRAVPLLLDERWHTAIIHYVCYRAFQLDESDTENGRRAQDHLGTFTAFAQN